MLIDYESYIPAGSKIAGLSVKEVESSFNLKIEIFHNSLIKNAISPDPSMVLQSGMTIKICNIDAETLASFSRYFDMP